MNLQKSCHRNGTPAAAPRATGPLALLALAGSLVAVLGMGGCAVEREPNYEFLPWLNSMFFSSAAEPYAPAPVNAKTGKPVFANGRVAQLPPAGTLPQQPINHRYASKTQRSAARFPRGSGVVD